MANCYIIGAGNFNSAFAPSKEDFVIAADGGYNHLKKISVRCDLLIGDFDSIGDVPNEVEKLKFPVKKDETDMHLAFLEGYRRGYRNFFVYGGTGGREDHTYANYCLLYLMADMECYGRIISDTGTVEVLRNGETVFTHTADKYVSVFPFGETARGVTIRGLEYECTDAVFNLGSTLGTSNRSLGTTARIGVKDGTLIIMKQM